MHGNAFFTFGKHRGMRLAETPQSYLRWIVENEVYKSHPDLESALMKFGALLKKATTLSGHFHDRRLELKRTWYTLVSC